MADTPPNTRRRRSGYNPDNGSDAGQQARPDTPPLRELPKPRKGSLESRLQEFFSMFAIGFSAMGDQHCALIISRGTPGLANAWSKLADESPAVKRVLDRLMAGGAWGGVIMATLPIVIGVAEHHNVLPEGWSTPFSTAAGVNDSNEPSAVPFAPTTPPPTV